MYISNKSIIHILILIKYMLRDEIQNHHLNHHTTTKGVFDKLGNLWFLRSDAMTPMYFWLAL
jgi:hypothetical protein